MNPPPPYTGAGIRVDALAIADERGVLASPASLLIETGSLRVLAVGTPEEVGHHPGSIGATRLSRPRAVLIPGLVNAHAHLDLTHIGPRPFDHESGFMGWVETIRRERLTDPEAIGASVRRGVELLRAGGTVAVGDIAGAPAGRPTLAPWRELARSGLLGVSYLEFFGIGARQAEARGRVEALLDEWAEEERPDSGVRLGLQPHAPNTISLGTYRWAVELALGHGLPLSTHLAETPDERLFVGAGRGPMRSLLERIGVWEPAVLDEVGHGRHPVEHLGPVLRSAPFLVAHMNDADDAAVETLASTGTSVAYCPRASAYFGAEGHFGGHRYRDMLRAGIRVALGTDSIVNLPLSAADQEQGGISVLEEMRLLFRRDGTDPALLLRMGTTLGAEALGLEPGLFRFVAGHASAGVVAVEVGGTGVDPLEAICRARSRAELLLSAK